MTVGQTAGMTVKVGISLRRMDVFSSHSILRIWRVPPRITDPGLATR